ncbi:hypothetical protein ISU02_18080 [Fusibacter sp. Q10-2]|uniref:Uncharacterized protein n=1 Tax=Fusibacter ferrireducens TaxID=2785058 RepID=A0ABR9ZX31_9FIRM|nr:hypothetical protein [Fusibacter ferrireducens]
MNFRMVLVGMFHDVIYAIKVLRSKEMKSLFGSFLYLFLYVLSLFSLGAEGSVVSVKKCLVMPQNRFEGM